MPWIIPIGQYRVSARDLLMRTVALGLMVIAALAIMRLFPAAWRDQASDLSPFLGPLFIVLALIVPWLWQKRHAGCVLLDLGRTAKHKGWLILGVSSTLIGIGLMASAIVLRDYGDSTREVRLVLFYLSLTALALGGLGTGTYFSFDFFGLSRFRITETGIFLGRFLKWERIESYEWGGESDHTLTVKIRSRLPFFHNTLMFPHASGHLEAPS